MVDHDEHDRVAEGLRALGDETGPTPSPQFADRLESSLRAAHATAGERRPSLRRILVRPVAVLGVLVVVVSGIALASLGGGPDRAVDAVATPAPTADVPLETPTITLGIEDRSLRAVRLVWEADDTTTIARWRLVALREREVELIARVGRTRTSIRVPRPLEAPLTVVIQAIDEDGEVLARSNAVVVPAR